MNEVRFTVPVPVKIPVPKTKKAFTKPVPNSRWAWGAAVPVRTVPPNTPNVRIRKIARPTAINMSAPAIRPTLWVRISALTKTAANFSRNANARQIICNVPPKTSRVRPVRRCWQREKAGKPSIPNANAAVSIPKLVTATASLRGQKMTPAKPPIPMVIP